MNVWRKTSPCKWRPNWFDFCQFLVCGLGGTRPRPLEPLRQLTPNDSAQFEWKKFRNSKLRFAPERSPSCSAGSPIEINESMTLFDWRKNLFYCLVSFVCRFNLKVNVHNSSADVITLMLNILLAKQILH